MGQRILSHQEFGNGHFCSAKIGTREKVGEEGVVQRCLFLFFVCLLFVFLFVCFFDTTRVYCARNKVLHKINYGETLALNSHINRGATNIFFHALHSSCSVHLICSVIGAFD